MNYTAFHLYLYIKWLSASATMYRYYSYTFGGYLKCFHLASAPWSFDGTNAVPAGVRGCWHLLLLCPSSPHLLHLPHRRTGRNKFFTCSNCDEWRWVDLTNWCPNDWLPRAPTGRPRPIWINGMKTSAAGSTSRWSSITICLYKVPSPNYSWIRLFFFTNEVGASGFASFRWGCTNHQCKSESSRQRTLGGIYDIAAADYAASSRNWCLHGTPRFKIIIP